jgi:hypothetical protein
MGCSGSRTSSNKNFKYCVAVDGSEQSNFGLNKIVNENFKKGNMLYLLHIYNPKKFLEMPAEMLPENLIPVYEKKISEKLQKKDYQIIKTVEKLNERFNLLGFQLPYSHFGYETLYSFRKQRKQRQQLAHMH